ncbi:MAG: type II toxin-antitoxin system Phd/YefM family antitoxin [Lysobacterales bacterium]
MSWQMQEAKNRLSEVVRAAETQGAQIISVHGKDTAVLLSLADYRKLQTQIEPLGTFLMRTAPRDLDIDPDELFKRIDEVDRPVDL